MTTHKSVPDLLVIHSNLFFQSTCYYVKLLYSFAYLWMLCICLIIYTG